MKYKGTELKEFTSDKPVVFAPGKRMHVWDDGDGVPETLYVYAYLPELSYPVVTAGPRYAHCAEIPEKPKPRRATNRELAKWLAQGKGLYRLDCLPDNWGSDMTLKKDTCECPVTENIQIRKWDDEEWHEPTADYMGLED